MASVVASNIQLKNLLNGPTVKIYYIPNPGAPKEILYDGVPKSMLVHFSGYFKKRFPDTNEPHTLPAGTDGKTFATVYGGAKAPYKVILRWMIHSCKANTIVPVEPHSFFDSIKILQAAEVLSVPPAEGQIQARLERIAAAQIPITDLREIYKHFPRGTKYRTMAIESIGNAVFERRLRLWGRYKEFRDECREYYDDINAYMKAKKEQQKLERELEASASNMVKKPQQRPSTVSATIPKDTKNPKKAKTTNTKQSNKPKEHEHKNQKVTTKTVSAAVVRKGKGSKPAYVSLPFLEVNIVDVQVAARSEQRGRAVSGSTNSDTSPPSEAVFSARSSTTSVSSVEARPQDTKQQGTRGTGKKKTWKGKNRKKYGKGPAKEKSEEPRSWRRASRS